MSLGFPGPAVPKAAGAGGQPRDRPTAGGLEGARPRCPACGRPLLRMRDWPLVRVLAVEEVSCAAPARDEVRAPVPERPPIFLGGRAAEPPPAAPGALRLRWSELPGEGSGPLLRFLTDEMGLDWAWGADVIKAVDGESVLVLGGRRWCRISLEGGRGRGAAELSDGRRFAVRVLEGRGDQGLGAIAQPEPPPPWSAAWEPDAGALAAAAAAVRYLRGFVGREVEPARLAELWRADGLGGERPLVGRGGGALAVAAGNSLLWLDEGALVLAPRGGHRWEARAAARVRWEGVLRARGERP